jgi:3-oxoadipate CoA-transferase alpha subunit
MVNKIFESLQAAVADVHDGATIMIGGFGTAGMPSELIDALIEQGARGLTIVNNNAGNGETGLAALLKAKRVRKIICSFPRQSDSQVFDGLYRAGEIELELVPQGNLAERIRAAGAGIGGFFTPTGFGTKLAEGKETRVIDGKSYVFETPIHADFALVKAYKGDRWGNLVYRKTARNFGPIMASAAKVAIVQVSEVVPLGALNPEHIVTPGIFVQRVVEVPQAAHAAELAANARKPLTARTSWDRRSRGSAAVDRRTEMKRLTRDEMAKRVAQDIPEGAYVNLGIGVPTLVANHLDPSKEIFLHSENGLLGMGPAPAPGAEDDELINAGKQHVTLLTGGAYFHHADSFAMMRGGHLDYCVLGAFQVSADGDLANWHTGAPDAIPAVGGAMDLAIGAKQVFVMMEHLTKQGEQDRRAVLVSGDGRAVREPHLHGSRRARRDGRRSRGARDLHGPVVRRTAQADRRAADRRDAQAAA